LIEHSEYSDSNSIGPGHAENQDSFLVNEQKMIFAIADGVGGYEGGKIASSIAIDILEHDAENISDEGKFRLSFDKVFKAIISKSKELGFQFMGTTLSAARVLGNKILFANVGDSPIFLIRHGKAIGFYFDDSMRERNPKNLWGLRQYVGFPLEGSVVHTRTAIRESGDILILCSDGVADNIIGPDMNMGLLEDLVIRTRSARKIVEEAIRMNYKRDDMSAILVSF
jgi:serine/threonine protein phosphatase PrpC